MSTTMAMPELAPESASFDQVVPARQPFHHEVKRGQYLRILDLGGNQAVDTIFYSAVDPAERYSAQDTVREQGNIFLSTGTVLYSNEGNPLMTIVADNCGRHDTLGGACSAESNSVRYGHHTKYQHACRDNFLTIMTARNLSKRDIVSNINFFMNVPVNEDGRLAIVDGISAPGYSVDLRAEMDVIVAISNCPQVNNPCNAFNPTPIRILVWEAPQG